MSDTALAERKPVYKVVDSLSDDFDVQRDGMTVRRGFASMGDALAWIEAQNP